MGSSYKDDAPSHDCCCLCLSSFLFPRIQPTIPEFSDHYPQRGYPIQLPCWLSQLHRQQQSPLLLLMPVLFTVENVTMVKMGCITRESPMPNLPRGNYDLSLYKYTENILMGNSKRPRQRARVFSLEECFCQVISTKLFQLFFLRAEYINTNVFTVFI